MLIAPLDEIAAIRVVTLPCLKLAIRIAQASQCQFNSLAAKYSNWQVRSDCFKLPIFNHCHRNHINAEVYKENSTGIGLKTCNSIIENHQEYLSIDSMDKQFTLQIHLPLSNDAAL
ncbi:GHKL domain-containing protein [Cohnella sp. LGH]|nr:GHKL domain-containing protein [Cohnella sp. LGH]